MQTADLARILLGIRSAVRHQSRSPPRPSLRPSLVSCLHYITHPTQCQSLFCHHFSATPVLRNCPCPIPRYGARSPSGGDRPLALIQHFTCPAVPGGASSTPGTAKAGRSPGPPSSQPRGDHLGAGRCLEDRPALWVKETLIPGAFALYDLLG